LAKFFRLRKVIGSRWIGLIIPCVATTSNTKMENSADTPSLLGKHLFSGESFNLKDIKLGS
jgi:hypothetical protein